MASGHDMGGQGEGGTVLKEIEEVVLACKDHGKIRLGVGLELAEGQLAAGERTGRGIYGKRALVAVRAGVHVEIHGREHAVGLALMDSFDPRGVRWENGIWHCRSLFSRTNRVRSPQDGGFTQL